MTTPDESTAASGLDTSARPAVVDRATWQAKLDTLRVREKAHTRAGDAIAAARRRLPMVAVDSTTTLIGPHGPVPLLEVFEGRRQLIVYFHIRTSSLQTGTLVSWLAIFATRIRSSRPTGPQAAGMK